MGLWGLVLWARRRPRWPRLCGCVGPPPAQGPVVIVQTCNVFIHAQLLRIHSVTASRELCWFIQAEPSSPVSRVIALRVRYPWADQLAHVFQAERAQSTPVPCLLAATARGRLYHWVYCRCHRATIVSAMCCTCVCLHLCDWHSRRRQSTVNVRHLENFGRPCHLQGVCPCHRSIEILTLGNVHSLLYLIGRLVFGVVSQL